MACSVRNGVLKATTILIMCLICGCKYNGAYDSPNASDGNAMNAFVQSIDVSESSSGSSKDKFFDSATNIGGDSTISAASPNNWYVDGYVVPSNWIPLTTANDAFECYDQIIGDTQSGKNINETIELLMKKNILVFETIQGRSFELDNAVEGYSPAEESSMQQIRSDYFESFDDIINLFNSTYTKDYSYGLLFGFSEGAMPLFSEIDGKIYVDNRCIGTWVTAPFEYQTYIEITNLQADRCEFCWHYISWDYYDYEGNDTDELYSHHNYMTFRAVMENDEWRLTSIVFDNPALDITGS